MGIEAGLKYLYESYARAHGIEIEVIEVTKNEKCNQDNH